MGFYYSRVRMKLQIFSVIQLVCITIYFINSYIYNMFNTRPWLYYDSKYTNKFVNTYIQGILDICGNIVLRNGGFRLTNGDISMNGNLYVGKNATFIGDVSMNGNLWVGLDASFNQNVSVKGTTTVNNDIYQISNKDNMNIASSVGTFPNCGINSDMGINLISIGSNNFMATQPNGLINSIAIGKNILSGASNTTGFDMLGIGKNLFPSLTNSTYTTIGIGSDIATSFITGYWPTFIGNGIAKNVVYCDSMVAIGTSAGTNGGNYSSFLGAYTGSQSTSYIDSTAIGFGATIEKQNQIRLGTASDTVDISGDLLIGGTLFTTNYIKPTLIGYSYQRTGSTVNPANGNLVMNANGWNTMLFDSGHLNINTGVFTVPVAGIYFFSYTLHFSGCGSPDWLRIELLQSNSTISNGSGFQTNSSNGTGSQVFVTGMTYLTQGATIYPSLSRSGNPTASMYYPHIATLYLMVADVSVS
jgi:hypothetical protein